MPPLNASPSALRAAPEPLSDEAADALLRKAWEQRHAGLIRKVGETRPDRVKSVEFSWVASAISSNWPKGLAAVLEVCGSSHLDADGRDALMRSVLEHRPECQKAALPFCDPKAADANGSTALMLAVDDDDAWQFAAERASAIDLLAAPSDANQENPEGRNVFELAVFSMADLGSAKKIAPFLSDPARALKALIGWHQGDGHDAPHDFGLIDELGHRCELTPARAEWFKDFVRDFAQGDFSTSLPKTFAALEAAQLREALALSGAHSEREAGASESHGAARRPSPRL